MNAVTRYKAMLAVILDKRPSGTRQRLASALGKNRSFISQIASPAYDTPIPAEHIETIFDVCHFSAAERRDFLKAYAAAHPRRAEAPPARATCLVELPDLGNDALNARLAGLVANFLRQARALIEEGSRK